MGDSSKFQGKHGGQREEEDEEARQPKIFDSKPRGLWQQLDGREPEPRERPRGMWNLINSRAEEQVQRKAGGKATAQDPSAVATAGVQSANERLPHHDQIQASFGRHDISGVRAQTGGGAAEASRGLGASAYAVGNRVGFAESPDVHTAAHEAAHVVQQQAGVQLKGGIDGGKEDPHEQHADAVADKVVRGESAEDLLDTVGSRKSGTSSSAEPVQRKSVQPDPARGKADALPAGVPRRGDYIAGLRPDKSYEFDFNTFDVHTWSDPVFTAFRYYMNQVFPGTSDAIVRQLASDLRIGFENHEPVPKEDDLLYAIHIMPSLHTSVVEWMHTHHPELAMQEPKTGGDGLRHADQGRKGGKGAKKAQPSRINGAGGKVEAGGRAKVESTIGISRELYERLRKAFPEEPIVHSRSAYPELLAYLADNADEVKRLQKGKTENAVGLEELKKLLAALKQRIESKGGSRDGDLAGHQDGKEHGGKEGSKDGDVRESRKGGDTDGSIYGEEGGGKYGWIQFDPKGDIRINPDLKTYVAGASLHAEMHWDTSVHPHAADAYLPNHCDYAWTIKHNGKIVDTAGKNHGFIDDRDKNFDVGDDPGVYEITVVATSRHFKSKTYTTTRTINAVSEKVADNNAFDAAHVTGPDATFSRDDKGALHLREGQTPLTVEQEIAVLDQTKGGVDNLATQGKISASNQETLDEQFAKQRKALLEVQEKTKTGTPYIVRGTFTSREDSSTMPLRVLMSVLQHSSSDGEAHYKVILHDTTFGDAQQHPGSSSHSLEGERLGTVYQMIEREALDDMFEHFHAHNDYPKGTLHLAAQQQMSGGVWEQTRDTNNTRKKFKRVLHGVAMVGGAALLIVPGGGVLAAGLMAVTTAAGVGGIALELEDRIAKEGGLKFDRRLMVDVVQLVGTALPFGAMTKTLAEASAVAKGRYLLCMASVDAAQGFMIASDVKAQLQLIDANAAVALANAKDDEERKQIIAERDQHVNEVVGGAIVGGGFVLVSLGGGIKQIVATSRAGGAFRVREPVAEIASQGRGKMQDTLANDTFPHESEQVKLTDEERSYLEHEIATPEVAKDPHATNEARKPVSERTTQKMPAADPHAKAAESEKAPSERTTQQMPAADPNAKAEAEKAPHERTTQKMPAVDPSANANGGRVTHVVFSGRGDTIAAAAAKVKPEGGYFDVVVHGDSKQFWVLHDGSWVPVKPNSVRSWLARSGNYHGGPIRLLSCESGAVADGLAQSFANGMRVRVKAPTETLWILDDGALSVGADPAKQTGSWHEFTPYKAGSKSSPSVEAPVPERGAEKASHAPAERESTGEAAREETAEPTALGKSKRKTGKGTPAGSEPPVEAPARTPALVERANALPAETPHRAEIVEDAKALEIQESGAAKDKPLGDEFEQKFKKLEEKLSIAEIPAKGIRVTEKAKELAERANKLPQKNQQRWELIAKAQDLSGDAEHVGELAKTDMRDQHLVQELKAIKEREEAFELEVVTAENGEKGPEPTVWKERIEKAKWTNHGDKHAKATTDEDARVFSSKSDDGGKAPPSQYLPEIDIPALEREALENGTPYDDSDLNNPDGTVYVWYDAHRNIGYDNGQLVQTMRVEITSGNVFHGHPRAVK